MLALCFIMLNFTHAVVWHFYNQQDFHRMKCHSSAEEMRASQCRQTSGQISSGFYSRRLSNIYDTPRGLLLLFVLVDQFFLLGYRLNLTGFDFLMVQLCAQDVLLQLNLHAFFHLSNMIQAISKFWLTQVKKLMSRVSLNSKLNLLQDLVGYVMFKKQK